MDMPVACTKGHWIGRRQNRPGNKNVLLMQLAANPFGLVHAIARKIRVCSVSEQYCP